MSPSAKRLPGDPAPTDTEFGPLGGLPDQVHFEHKRTERERERAGERLGAAAGRPSLLACLRRLLGGI